MPSCRESGYSGIFGIQELKNERTVQMIIDFHTHAFPEKIAARALEKLSYSSGGMLPCTDGTPNGLKKRMTDSGVDTSVVLNIATNEKQMKSVNDFAASINDQKNIFAFGSVFPSAADALDELERIKALGLRGVKFHPEYQGFFADDEKMKPIYKKISELGLITVFHAGFDYGYEAPFHCMPDNMLGALKYLDAPVVAAHWGGLCCGYEVLEKLCGEQLFIDTSFGYGQMPRSLALAIVEKHGADKLLFATDSPWHTAEDEMRFLDTLGLSENERAAIMSENAKKLLKI